MDNVIICTESNTYTHTPLLSTCSTFSTSVQIMFGLSFKNIQNDFVSIENNKPNKNKIDEQTQHWKS